MSIFPNTLSIKRQGALEILNSLPADIPGVLEARAAAVSGQPAAPILRLAWERFSSQRSEELIQMTFLSIELSQLRHSIDSYLNQPVMVELRNTQSELAVKAELAGSLESRLVLMQQSHERERNLGEQEISRLKALVADQNRIIAMQQLAYEKITGEKLSD